jgi:hypothetical protein
MGENGGAGGAGRIGLEDAWGRKGRPGGYLRGASRGGYIYLFAREVNFFQWLVNEHVGKSSPMCLRGLARMGEKWERNE